VKFFFIYFVIFLSLRASSEAQLSEKYESQTLNDQGGLLLNKANIYNQPNSSKDQEMSGAHASFIQGPASRGLCFDSPFDYLAYWDNGHSGKQGTEKKKLHGGCFLKGLINFTCPGNSLLVGIESEFDPYEARRYKGRYTYLGRTFKFTCAYFTGESDLEELEKKECSNYKLQITEEKYEGEAPIFYPMSLDFEKAKISGFTPTTALSYLYGKQFLGKEYPTKKDTTAVADKGSSWYNATTHSCPKDHPYMQGIRSFYDHRNLVGTDTSSSSADNEDEFPLRGKRRFSISCCNMQDKSNSATYKYIDEDSCQKTEVSPPGFLESSAETFIGVSLKEQKKILKCEDNQVINKIITKLYKIQTATGKDLPNIVTHGKEEFVTDMTFQLECCDLLETET
jgi:hypothetical protein